MRISQMQQVLTNGHARRVVVRLPRIPVHVQPSHLAEVARRLVQGPPSPGSGMIGVVVDGSLGNLAEYRWRGANTLAIPRNSFPSSAQDEALLVHEAVHAYQDIHHRHLQWDTHEMLAYVTQMAYIIRRVPSLGSAVEAAWLNTETLPSNVSQCSATPGGGACSEETHNWARSIAYRLRAGQEPTPAQMQGLRRAILRDPTYSRMERRSGGRAAMLAMDGV